MTKNKKEQWKDVPDYEGLYKISSRGRVLSLKYGRERFLKQCLTNSGYLSVDLSKDGKRKTFNIHVLVAMGFLNHIPCGSAIHVHHEDEVKSNNNLSNLSIRTARQNTVASIKGGTSQYTGVYWNKKSNKWRARIYINGKLKHLGYFTNEVEASEAYQTALKNIMN